MRNSRRWLSAVEQTKRGSGSGGTGNRAGLPTSIPTSGSESRAFTLLSGRVGTDGAAEVGFVVVVRAGGSDRSPLL